ncbi:MAG: GDYXXLXY domain-containing protein [Planctomycetaceae bacterium]
MRPGLAVFVVVVIAQWLLPLSGIWQHERVISRGTLLKIECGAPDPYDPLRGRYLAVRPKQSTVSEPEGFPRRGGLVPVWATLETGDDGLARITSLSLEPVSGPTIIPLTARKWGTTNGTDVIWLDWPFDRFYLNERLAPEADKLVAERSRDRKTVAEVRLLDGRAVLTDILLDGVSIREVVKRRAK